MSETGAYRAALLAGLICTTPAVLWAIGAVTLSADAASAALADGAAGLWLAQALCLAVLLPSCGTLWRSRDMAGATLSFALFPLPVLVLAWLIGVLSSAALWRGPLLLLAGAATVFIASTLVRAFVRGPASAAAVLSLQVTLGIITFMFRETLLTWTGL